MKITDGPSVKKIKNFSLLMVLSLIMIISCYSYHNYVTYKSIRVVAIRDATVEYGSANYDVKKLLKEVEGKIVSVKQDIDTKTLGAQEVILEVQKDNVIKEVPFVISVVDSIAPTIELKSDRVEITQGDSYDLNENISQVLDATDGEISLLSLEEQSSYYTFHYDDIESVGTHEIEVYAIDNSGNSSTQKFTLEVLEPVWQPVYYSLPVSVYGGNVSSIAYSLLGRPYISGSNGPYGFDCSGFVQYVYSQVGVSVSRSTYTQLYDGLPVRYEEAQPGDILVWGYGNGQTTHSTLYVGNGLMIHAANPAEGVILSDVGGWMSGSGTILLSVRRVQ